MDDDACKALWCAIAELLFALPADEVLARASIGQTTIVAVLDGAHAHLAEQGPFGTFAVKERRSHLTALLAQRVEMNIKEAVSVRSPPGQRSK